MVGRGGGLPLHLTFVDVWAPASGLCTPPPGSHHPSLARPSSIRLGLSCQLSSLEGRACLLISTAAFP